MRYRWIGADSGGSIYRDLRGHAFLCWLAHYLVGCKKDLRYGTRVIEELRKTRHVFSSVFPSCFPAPAFLFFYPLLSGLFPDICSYFVPCRRSVPL